MDYKNGKIYKLVSNYTDNIYIGSTCSLLSKRLNGHRADYNKNHQITSKEICKYDDVKIILIEDYPCKSKNQLIARERYYIDLHKDICINKQIPSRTLKEWRETNKEHLAQIGKEYREANKDKIKEMKKTYYDANKDKISEDYKIKYESNKTYYLEKSKEYAKNHKEQIAEYKKHRQTLKYDCECGSKVVKDKKSMHFKSKKHIAFLEQQ